MASTGELKHFGALHFAPAADPVVPQRTPAKTGTEGDAAAAPSTALTKTDSGATAFRKATYEPVGLVSFEWTNLSQVTSLATPAPQAAPPVAAADGQTFLDEAEALLAQLQHVDSQDATAHSSVIRLQSALEDARRTPGNPDHAANIYTELLALRSNLLVTAKAKPELAGEAAQLRQHIDTILLSGPVDVAEKVAQRQVHDVLNQASFVRDLKGTDLLAAVQQDKLSDDAKTYLTSQGYAVQGHTLLNTRTGQTVTTADIPAVGKELFKFAAEYLGESVRNLKEDEEIHLQALPSDQQDLYQFLRTTLNDVVQQTQPKSLAGALMQSFVFIQASPQGTAWGEDVESTPTMDASTLDTWRTQGISATIWSALPETVRTWMAPYVTVTADGTHQLKATEQDLERVRKAIEFAKKPSTHDGDRLMNSYWQTARQARMAKELGDALTINPTDVARALANALGFTEVPAAPELAAQPIVRPRPRAGKPLHTNVSIAKPHLARHTASQETEAEAKQQQRQTTLPGEAAMPAPTVKSGQEILARLKDEQKWTTRLTAQRFAQQLRNQQVLEAARTEREEYAAAVQKAASPI